MAKKQISVTAFFSHLDRIGNQQPNEFRLQEKLKPKGKIFIRVYFFGASDQRREESGEDVRLSDRGSLS
jgi:hypothetical protein